MRRHLSGADSTTGRGGPAVDLAQIMNVVSLVSTDVGQLREKLGQTDSAVRGLRADQEQLQGLANDVKALSKTVGGLSELVKTLTGQDEAEKETPPPPPQPWDWAGMSWEQRAQSLATLSQWVEGHLIRWWPRVLPAKASKKDGVGTTTTGLPSCWIHHPDMLRALSYAYVSYQQAYLHPERRVHHESDYRRALEDALGDISAAATAYGCYTGGDQHVTDHPGRSDRAAGMAHMQQLILEAVVEAYRAGDETEVVRLVDTYNLTPEQVRGRMLQVYQGLPERIHSDRQPVRETAAREAGRLLRDYQVRVPGDLRAARDVGEVIAILSRSTAEEDRALFRELSSQWTQTAVRHRAITERLPQIRAAGGLVPLDLFQAGISQEDVDVVASMHPQ